VLITLGGLRTDAVGFLGAEPATLTPHLDALAAEADWAGPAVAPSSAGLVSLASYATGLGAWAHGVGFGEAPLALPPEVRTLGEALAERGYRGAAYFPPWLERAPGWGQGFGFRRDLGGGGRAAGHLESLDGGRDFVWIHLGDAEAPFARQDASFDRLPPLPRELLAALPERLSQADLEALRDPAAPAGATEREAVATLYRLAVAAADERLGEMLAGLRAGGRWDDALLVVVSTHGQELVEPGTWGLARARIEVPLVVKLPRRLAGEAAGRLPAAGSRPAAASLWATVAEAVGAAVPPAPSPSLFSAAPGALSELYLGDGVNETSWVEGDLQLLRRVRFAAPEEPLHALRLARVGALAAGDPQALLARVDRAFSTTPCWAGHGDAETLLVAWRDGGAEPVDDPHRQGELAAAMERRRHAFTPCDETPGAAAAHRAAERSAAAGD
jgi:arylsulfatase A-like enzyme